MTLVAVAWQHKSQMCSGPLVAHADRGAKGGPGCRSICFEACFTALSLSFVGMALPFPQGTVSGAGSLPESDDN